MALATPTPKTLSGSGVLYTDRRQFYLKPNQVAELWTDIAPFTTIAANRNIITGLSDPLFKLFEHRSAWIKQRFVITTATEIAANGAESAAITVSNASNIGLPATVTDAWQGMEVEIWDSTETTRRGVAFIFDAYSSTQVTMKTLYPTAITTVSGDICHVIGNVQGEGSYAPEAWADELEIKWGSTQIMETPIEITGTLYQTALRGYSNELARLRSEKQKEHKMLKERTFLFGDSVIGIGGTGESFADTMRTAQGQGYHETTVTTNVRSAMGIVTAIERYGSSDVTNDDQNLFTIPEATYKYANFVDDMEKVFRYMPTGGGAKYALCGMGAMSYFSKMELATKQGWNIQLGPVQRDSMGFNIRLLETPHGFLNLVPTPAFRGPRNKWFLIISDENVSYVQFDGDQFMNNIKTDNGYKGVKDLYRSDVGAGFTLLESHKLFKIV